MGCLDRYPLPLAPDRSESLISIIHRLSERNGFGDALSLYQDMRVHHLGQEITPSQLAALATRGGFKIADLVGRQTSRRPDGKIQFLEFNLHPHLTDRQRLSFCLPCLQEFGFHRLIWELVPIGVCPIHQATLLNTCPICEDPLTRNRKNVFICRKGHDLREIALPLPAAAMDLNCAAAIYERCGLTNILPCPPVLPHEFQALDLGELIDTLLLLGRIKGCILRNGAHAGSLTFCQLFHLASDVVRNWPEIYWSDLQLLRSADRFLTAPIDKQIQDLLCHSMRRGIGCPIAKATLEFARQSGFIFPEGTFGIRSESPNKLFLSIGASAKVMSLDKRRAKLLAERHRWPGWQGISKENYCLLRASDIYKWTMDNSNLLSPDVARRRIGCSEELIRELIVRGCFGNPACDRCHGAYSHKMISHDEVEAFRLAISNSVVPSDGKGITWRGFARAFKTSLSFGDVVLATRRGRIHPCSWDGHSLISMRFSQTDLKALDAGNDIHAS